MNKNNGIIHPSTFRQLKINQKRLHGAAYTVPIQERIPVGCVPTTKVASILGGVHTPIPYPPILYPLDPYPLDTLLPKKGHGTTDTLNPERTWYQGYPTPPAWTDNTSQNITFSQCCWRSIMNEEFYLVRHTL